jgi:hypothetical protein
MGARRDKRSHPSAPLYYPGNASVQQADQLSGSLQLSFTQILGEIADAQVPESAVTQHEAALSLTFPQLTDTIGDAQVPASAVTQHADQINLDDLGDVNAPTPGDGDALTWDDGAGEWVATALGGGSPHDLDSHTDVNAPTPADGDVLTWDDTAGEWVAAAPTGGGGGSIDGSGTGGQLAKWSDSDTLTDSLLSDDGTNVTDDSTAHITTANTHTIRPDTSDGSDTKKISLIGGGAESGSRGGMVLVHGNEHGTWPGNVNIFAGTAGHTRYRGTILFDTDNTYDIGAAGATRPRDVYIAGNLSVGGTISGGNGVSEDDALPTDRSYILVKLNSAGSDFTTTDAGSLSSSGGTVDSPTPANTSLVTSMRAARFKTTAAASQVYRWVINQTSAMLHRFTSNGGFKFIGTFGFVTQTNGQHFGMGIHASTNPHLQAGSYATGITDCVFIGFDTGDAFAGNYQLYHNDASGTSTKVDTGVARDTSTIIKLIISCASNGDITVTMKNAVTGATLYTTTLTTNIPTAGTSLRYGIWGGTGSVATAVDLRVTQLVIWQAPF